MVSRSRLRRNKNRNNRAKRLKRNRTAIVELYPKDANSEYPVLRLKPYLSDIEFSESIAHKEAKDFLKSKMNNGDMLEEVYDYRILIL